MTNRLDEPQLTPFEFETKSQLLRLQNLTRETLAAAKEGASDAKLARETVRTVQDTQLMMRTEQRQHNGELSTLQTALDMLTMQHEEGFKRIIARLNDLERRIGPEVAGSVEQPNAAAG